MRYIIALFLVCLNAKADIRDVCYWQHCQIADQGLVVCSRPSLGKPSEMYRDEEQNRGRGKLFNRECVAEGEQPILKWFSGGNMFMMGERE